ncbi:MAG: tRNA 2-thiocytidine(32) synthetase TtcA [Epulopiscium sp.]|nr:tRNA 2-thiocytidine(32) synthetase TtcA [Candidatus Epulonipiscium sp.]
MNMKLLLSYTRKAIDQYHMIQDGDRIAVGISGGKDSLVLLKALKGLQFFYPKKFEIEAITVDMGFPGVNLQNIQNFCDDLKIHYTISKTNIAEIIFDERKEKNPCSLCAKMRKGVLHDTALELDCNKVALGHHKDDVVETLFLSLFFESRIHTFAPVTYLDRKNLYCIRPLIYVLEKDIVDFTENEKLPIVKNSCIVDGYTKREYIKSLLKQLNEEHPNLTNRLFKAIESSFIKGWTKEDSSILL